MWLCLAVKVQNKEYIFLAMLASTISLFTHVLLNRVCLSSKYNPANKDENPELCCIVILQISM